MHPTIRLFSKHPLRLTLFTHSQCSLCEDIKSVMSRIWDKRPFEYREVDIKAQGMEKWKTLYEFDVPVVHVERNDGEGGEGSGVLGKGGRKVKHRSTVGELEGVMDEVENANGR